ncbi:DUF3817 domain-containing protein [Hymenobacter wooponensis]|uniref:DUF3817 domain-containing protein n=1 Tax=Hymenobacter wooponensis TaxID=1525360 RepID=A0A4Z0MJ97_9BACT|nr:DUF3817 domain-containing protein [Hymenobacter wooponensis]TGD79614.1 DUF3817 domain-containing protein [Hymenobacter wooponensis]
MLKSPIGRLRLLGYAEGLSLLLLIGVAVPLKYFYHDPTLVRALGPVHGAMFLLFIVNSLRIGLEDRWPAATLGKVLLSCVVPFGTFYADHVLLKPLQKNTPNS